MVDDDENKCRAVLMYDNGKDFEVVLEGDKVSTKTDMMTIEALSSLLKTIATEAS